jgi:hypothetical protein
VTWTPSGWPWIDLGLRRRGCCGGRDFVADRNLFGQMHRDVMRQVAWRTVTVLPPFGAFFMIWLSAILPP